MINIIKTLQYMKPDIQVMVWENNIDKIKYNDAEKFRPTKKQILAVDQSLVSEYWEKKEKEDKQTALADISAQIQTLQQQLNSLQEG